MLKPGINVFLTIGTIFTFAISSQAQSLYPVSPSSDYVEVSEGQEITFTVQGDSVTTWYQARWYMDVDWVETNDFNEFNETSWSHVFISPGTHHVNPVGVYEVINGGSPPTYGIVANIDWTVVVLPSNPPNQPPVADAGGPYSGTAGQALQFDGSGSSDSDGTIYSYVWDFGDAHTGTGMNPSHSYGTAGNYTVSLTVTDNDGASDTATTTASINPPANVPPVADAGGPYSGTAGQALQFDGSGSSDSDGTIVSYMWDFGDGHTGTGMNPSHSYGAAGNYTVSLTVTDDDGASDTATTTASINPPPNVPPVADAGGPYSGTAGQLVQFNGSGSSDSDGTIVSYTWDFGDGTTTTGMNPMHTFTAAGTFTVVLTVTDDDGGIGSNSTSAVISQIADQPPVADAGGPYEGVTKYLPVVFDGSGSYDPDGTIVSYEWNFGDGNSGAGVTPSHYYQSVGDYNVTLTVTDSAGHTATDTATVHIKSLAPPEPVPGGPYSGQVGVPVQFDGSGSYDPDGTIDSYEWDFGDGTKATGVNPVHVYTTAGTYTVTLTVYDNDSNWAKFATTAVITQIANHPPIANPGGVYSGQVGQTIQFDGSGSSDPDGTIVSYTWDFGDGTTTTGMNPTHTFTAAGAFTVVLTVTDDDGGTGSNSTSAVISQIANQPPVADAGGSYSGKVGESILFEGYSSQDPDGTIITYEWDFGDGSSTTGDTIPRHTYTAAGTYIVTLTVTDNDGASDTATTTVEITQTDNQPPIANAKGPYVGQPGQPLQFDASDSYDPDGTIVSYEWDFGDGGTATGVSPVHTYTEQGNYPVHLTVKDDQGASDTYLTSAEINETGDSSSNSDGYIGIAAGNYYSIAIKADGSIIGWGNNDFGQADSPEGNDFVAIAASVGGGQHNLALRANGSIVGWGDNQYGQADPPAGNDFIAMAAGRNHSLALKSDGSIIAWGDNTYGQINSPPGNDFIAIAAGAAHSLALKSDGSILAWGRNTGGQSDAPAGNDFVAIAAGGSFSLALKTDGSIVGWGGKNTYGQTNPPAGNDYVAISAGRFHALALKSDGSIVAWGGDEYGQATPPVGNDYVAIAAGGYHNLAMKADGTIVGWGSNDYGQATPPSGQNIISISTGCYHSLALKEDGSIVGWGNNEFGQADPPEGNDFIDIAVGSDGFHSLALRADGSIVGWGDNQYGQASAPAGNDFISIAAGLKHSLALKSDGSIIAWGDNANGQINSPSGNDFVAIAAGTGHSLALKSDGSILAWGRNTFGQSTPPAGHDFVAIAGGGQFSLALKMDGSIVGWGGKNGYGQASPPAGNDFVAISAGKFHALALKSDGTIVAWGDDEYGQSTPPEGNDYVAISAGGYHSLAVKADGTIIGWGLNSDDQATPPTKEDTIRIDAGNDRSLVLNTDGYIIDRDHNEYSQDGTE